MGKLGSTAGPLRLLGVLLLIVVVQAIAPGSYADAGGVEAERWTTRVSPHFRLHTHASVEALADDVIVLLEQAHEVLVPVVGSAPSRRTDVVLTDESDAANGSATVYPNNRMQLFASSPDSWDIRDDVQHRMWSLIVHEYMHILHVHQIRGLPALINVPFGRIYAPNQFLPRWLLEGIATWAESRYGGGGRVHSSAARSYIRAAALADTIPTLAQLSNSPPDFPHGSAYYVFGGAFVDFIVRRHSEAALATFMRNYSRRLMPYAENAHAIRAFGETFTDMYAVWVDQVKAEASAVQQAQASIVAPCAFEPWSDERYFTRFSAWDRQTGRLGVITVDGISPPTLTVSGGTEYEIELEAGGGFAFEPDARHVIISQPAVSRTWFSQHDLFRLDLQDGSRQRLTRNRRATSPDISPDGGRVAYVSNHDGRRDLRELNLDTGEDVLLFAGGPWGQVSDPTYGARGDHILFSYAPVDGRRDIYSLSREDLSVVQHTFDDAVDNMPAPVPGTDIVLFSSDRDGVFNIYALRLSDGDVRRVSAEALGAYSPQPLRLHNGVRLAVTLFDERGYYVATTDLPPDFYERAPPAPASYEREAVQRPDVDINVRTRGYNGIFRSYPRRWSLVYEREDDGDRLLGAGIEGRDPGGHYWWNADVAYNLDRQHTNLWLRGGTNRLPLDFSLDFSRTVGDRFRDLIAASRYVPFEQEVVSAALHLGLPIDGFAASHYLWASWRIENRSFVSDPGVENRPWDFQPRHPELGRYDALSFGWSFSNTRRYADSISSAAGTRASIGARVRAPWTRADYTSLAASFEVRHYHSLRPEHHVLAFLLAGGGSVAEQGGRSMGGVGSLNWLSALQNGERAPTTSVRGYPEFTQVGAGFALASLEYRFPLLRPSWGVSTLPLFLDRIHGAIFVDVGHAFSGAPELVDALVGVGGELRVAAVLGYFLGLDMRFGVARGLSGPSRGTRAWATLGTSF